MNNQGDWYEFLTVEHLRLPMQRVQTSEQVKKQSVKETIGKWRAVNPNAVFVHELRKR
tara:strand:+ start:4000 stop:4173 length:174 start_codon:yes stop_codon:yes gene_type:complete